MRNPFTGLSTLFVLALTTAQLPAGEFPVPEIPFEPESYICFRVEEPLLLDGRIDEDSWKAAPWSQDFVDIEGHLKPKPHHLTRVKMLWDDQYLYIGAELDEPHIWATLKKRDSIIFYDNDFEVFIDPDGDTHNYYELEVNAMGTEWDLLLLKPYRDQGRVAVDSWDIAGLKTAIHIDGSLNDPSDVDQGWSLELAIPWQVLEECATSFHPADGDQWRINFSRVQWDTEVVNGDYVKLDQPEHNWVWSPQGLINMHYPERWGFVQFSTELPSKSSQVVFNMETQELAAVQLLRQFYYRQRQYNEDHGQWAQEIDKLHHPGYEKFNAIELRPTHTGYEASIRLTDGTRHLINHTGRSWKIN